MSEVLAQLEKKGSSGGLDLADITSIVWEKQGGGSYASSVTISGLTEGQIYEFVNVGAGNAGATTLLTPTITGGTLISPPEIDIRNNATGGTFVLFFEANATSVTISITKGAIYRWQLFTVQY